MEEEKHEKHTHHAEHASHHKDSTQKKINLYNVFIGIAVLLGIVLLINIILTSGIQSDLKKTTEELKEKLKPAKIELTAIKNSRCIDCYDISLVLSQLKTGNVEVTKENTVEFDSKEGKELISKYKIEKVPTVIVTGEIDKVSIPSLEKKQDALVFAKIPPPYTNSVTGKIEGRVTAYLLSDFECEKCNDLKQLITQIRAAGVKISEEKNVSISSSEGKELMKKYNIDFVPTLVLSKEASGYDIIKTAWPQVGSTESDGAYVLRTVYPPFFNLTTSTLRGLVDIVYLVDKTCTECYDVSVHNQILTSPQGFDISLKSNETVDINDAKGKDLVQKYNITQVPITILSKEVRVYPASKALRQFFTAEEDGSFVFRSAHVVGAYKDLTTGQVVKPQQESEADA